MLPHGFRHEFGTIPAQFNSRTRFNSARAEEGACVAGTKSRKVICLAAPLHSSDCLRHERGGKKKCCRIVGMMATPCWRGRPGRVIKENHTARGCFERLWMRGVRRARSWCAQPRRRSVRCRTSAEPASMRGKRSLAVRRRTDRSANRCQPCTQTSAIGQTPIGCGGIVLLFNRIRSQCARSVGTLQAIHRENLNHPHA